MVSSADFPTGGYAHGTPSGSNVGGQGPVPAGGEVRAGDPVQALAFLRAGLDYLAHADAAQWPAGVQADCLRALAVAESRQAAAHARLLAAFSVPGGGLAGDGHRSARVWLTWQTRATRRAAAAQVARMQDLQSHPQVGAALAAGQVSLSWARQITGWTSPLPDAHRGDADTELLAAARHGAGLPDLAQIAADLHRRHAAADTGGDGFDDRAVHLATTFDGAGRLEGDLTARCAAAVHAVLDSLSAARGPDDTRTAAQRRHDALEEACTRLIAADCLPERAGQPVRLELSITLDELARGGAGSPAGTASPSSRPSRCYPAPPGGPPGSAARSPARPPRRSACPSTSPPPSTPSRSTCAARSANATSTAGSPAATSPQPAGTCTTSSTAKTAAGTPWPTSPCCADSTTRSPSTAGAGNSPSTPTAPPPPPAPTAPKPCTPTHHQRKPPEIRGFSCEPVYLQDRIPVRWLTPERWWPITPPRGLSCLGNVLASAGAAGPRSAGASSNSRL
jgi:Domain of unknown function (DUF222)